MTDASPAYHLLRIRHRESLESVIDHPRAYVFERTSYCAAPDAWTTLAAAELDKRVYVLLDAGYKKRAWSLRDSEDPTSMVLRDYDWAWVDPAEASARPWTKAFHGFIVSEDGQQWRILPFNEVTPAFDTAFQVTRPA